MNTYSIVGGKAKNIKAIVSVKLGSLNEAYFHGKAMISGVEMEIKLHRGRLNNEYFLITTLNFEQCKQIGAKRGAKIAFDIPEGIIEEAILLEKEAYKKEREFELSTNINGDY